MSWRYMAARETFAGGEEGWTIREVFTDDAGRTSWTDRDEAPYGSSYEELREALRMMTFDIERRDFLDLNAESVAHRSGGLRSVFTRLGRAARADK